MRLKLRKDNSLYCVTREKDNSNEIERKTTLEMVVLTRVIKRDCIVDSYQLSPLKSIIIFMLQCEPCGSHVILFMSNPLSMPCYDQIIFMI